MSFSLKRPKRIDEEDEDELMRFQEEFLKNKSIEQPAAKVIRCSDVSQNDTSTSKNTKKPVQTQFDCKK